MSNYYEDIMPISTNEDEYLKYYTDESLSLFEKLNLIIKKGEPFQRQALITNLNVYAKDTLFNSLIQFIISDIGTWEVDSIVLFPKSLYKIIINNTLKNDLFNTILKHMIINVSTGADITKNEYTLYFDKIIEFYSPTKDYINTDNQYNNNISNKKEFPYTINDDIFEFIISLGKFGQSTINRRLCAYLSSSLCRLIIKDENNIQDDNAQKLYKRLSYLFCDGEKMIESQIVRELQYIIPIFKDIMFTNEDINQAIECYIKHDTEHVSQSMTLITLMNNIVNIEEQKKIIEILFNKIKEIIEVKEYEINHKNDIMNTLINSSYYNFKLVPKIINKIFDLGLIEYYINNFDCLESINIFIKNFDKLHFLMNNLDENNSNIDNNTENTSTFTININQTQISCPPTLSEIKYQTKIQFDELFLKIYNKIYNDYESNETSSSNMLLLEQADSLTNISKDNENIPLNETKKLLFNNIHKIFLCINPYIKGNKILMDAFQDLFKKEYIINILNYYYDKNNINENKTKNNKFYKILTLLIKYNYKKYINNFNNNNLNIKEFIYENNYFNKIFSLILNNIFSQLEEILKSDNSEICLLLADTLNLLIPKIYKYLKNIVIITITNTNNLNYVINSKENNNNNVNKKNYSEKLFDEIFTKIISVIICKNNIGDYIKKEYILIIPNLILYSSNRKKYLDFVKKEIIKSTNFFYRKYSIIFMKKCFDIFSFNFMYKFHLYDDILILIKDNINIISTAIIDLIYKNNKKIIVYSPTLFKDICDLLNDVYDKNIKAFNNDIKNFDKEKNIIINQIFNIKDLNSNSSKSKDKNNMIFYTEEELCSTKDSENVLFTIENDIFNLEYNLEKNKNQNNNEQEFHDVSIQQRNSSTSCSFQAIKNNLSNNHILYNPRGSSKNTTMLDKNTSNIMKNLTSKNIGGNKHYLPKIRGQKLRKDSNCSNGSSNGNKNNEPIIINHNLNYKNGIKDKEKINNKSKTKLIPCSQTRSPSAKMHGGNLPINNTTYDEISYKNNYKVNNRSISNKNVNIALKQYVKEKSLNIQKDTNNTYIHGNNIMSKIFINAEKTNSTNSFFK